MTKYKLEYIWLDGYEPVPNLRGQDEDRGVRRLPGRSRSSRCGASTAARPARPTAATRTACCKPVAIFPDPARKNGALVMCEVHLPDGTPHPSNSRADDPGRPGHVVRLRAGVLPLRDGAPLGFPAGGGFPAPQGEYYTGVGYRNVGSRRA